MPFWVDKYAPKSFNKLDFNLDNVQKIKNIIESGNFPHLLIYGPNGSGKKTRVHCILRLLYGNAIDKLRLDTQSFTTPSKKNIEIHTISSNYHLEVNAGDAGIYDRIVIQELIKTMASSGQIDKNKQRDFKVVVLHCVDQLSIDAQHALRRTMEKYIATCRLILVAESITRIIPAARSRCLPIRISAPTVEDIVSTLTRVAKKEGLEMPLKLAERIAIASERNMRRAFLMAEVSKIESSPFTAEQSITLPDWQDYIHKIAELIIEEQSSKRIIEVRSRLYDLLSHCIPVDVIFKGLFESLFVSCDAEFKLKLIELVGEYDHRLQLGSKPIFHLEAFVIAFMAAYKKYQENVF